MKGAILKGAIFFILLCVLSVFFFGAKNSYAGFNPIIKRIELKYSKIRTITAGFSQKEIIKGYSQAMFSKGTYFYMFPDKMLWVYTSPYAQKVLLSNGRLYIVNPSIKQVSVFNIKKRMGGFPPDIISLLGKLTDFFHVVSVRLLSASDQVELKMTPLKLQKAKIIYADFNKADLSLRSIKILTYQGQTNMFSFKNVRFNSHISASKFVAKFPSGYRIVKETE